MRRVLITLLAWVPLLLLLSVAVAFERQDRRREAEAFEKCTRRRGTPTTSYEYFKLRLPSGTWHKPICMQVVRYAP